MSLIGRSDRPGEPDGAPVNRVFAAYRDEVKVCADVELISRPIKGNGAGPTGMPKGSSPARGMSQGVFRVLVSPALGWPPDKHNDNITCRVRFRLCCLTEMYYRLVCNTLFC